jgi:hypothetical protein
MSAEETAFRIDWQTRYLAALEKKAEVLAGLEKAADARVYDAAKTALEIANQRVQALELEQKIRYTKLALADFQEHASRQNATLDARQQEAQRRIEEIVSIARQHAPLHSRLRDLLDKHETTNLNDPEEVAHIYSSLKTALQQLKIIE